MSGLAYLAVTFACAATIFAAGLLAGWCAGRYGWRARVRIVIEPEHRGRVIEIGRGRAA